MRVVAGTARGIPLEAPRGRTTRPTLDRVKEALFSRLGDAVVDARVLDLFAGSGALGIEALSRGARFAVFVEQDPSAVRVIDRNLKRTGLAPHARLARGAVETWLGRLLADGERFSLILADPPYRHGWPLRLCHDPRLHALADDAALLVVEHEVGAATGGLWQTWRRSRYGSTELSILTKGEKPTGREYPAGSLPRDV